MNDDIKPKKKRLSNIQAQVVDALDQNEGSYLLKSNLYHWSKVIHNQEIIMTWIHKPTVDVLIRMNIIVQKEGNIYILRQPLKQPTP